MQYQYAFDEIQYQYAFDEIQYQYAFDEIQYQYAFDEIQYQYDEIYQYAFDEIQYQYAFDEIQYQYAFDEIQQYSWIWGGYDIKYPPQPYGFGYEIKDHHGNQQYRKEHSDGKKVIGSYGFTDAHGIHRLVDYVADEHGFRAKVRTNEPGTANQDPANVHIQSSAYHGPIGDYH
ncbi:uncharacterized protein CEXT_295321 [Caerostris extrusa]|uniref:Cuticle protein n=1 Tax=Caerostris extrusa TaxID=172846 RepID=A0AAV4VD08_CAEEX|nr:uncharacterized protein CEXT_295321 [Caerostris extrusa]